MTEGKVPGPEPPSEPIEPTEPPLVDDGDTVLVEDEPAITEENP